MRSAADNMRMTYPPADDMQMTYPPADIRTMSGWHMSSASPNLQRSLTLVSSAHRHIVLHVVRVIHRLHRTHETSVPRLFQVKQQRTALLHTDRRSSLHPHLPIPPTPWIPYTPDTLLRTPLHPIFPPPERTWYQGYPNPPPHGQTDTCENITFLQFRLRSVTTTGKLQERKVTQGAGIPFLMTLVVTDHLCLFTSASCFIWSPTEATKSLFVLGESEHESNVFLWYLLSFSMKRTLIPKTLSEGGIVFAQC